MRPLATRPLPVLIAALASGALLTLAAMAFLPRLSALWADWPPAAVEATFALVLYGPLALVGWAGRREAGVGAAATSASSSGQGVVAGLLIGVGGYLIAIVLAQIAGAVGGVGPTATAGWAALLLGTLVVVGQSAAEELFFRGWLQPVLVRGWGAGVGVAVAAAAFAALHVAGGARSFPALLNLFIGGLLFGLLALRSAGLWAPIAAHAAWNWSEIILFGLDPNPGIGSFGAIHDVELVGSAWWGGSAEGMNASAEMTLVLAALTLPLAMARGGWPFRPTGARD